MTPVPAATDVWDPLAAGDWNVDTARHLLRRAGWTARPVDVDRAVKDGLPATLDRLFPASPPLFPLPKLVAEVSEDTPEYQQKIKAAPPLEKRELQREARERAQAALQDMTVRWLEFASRAENAAVAKWVLFLSDVYVVASEKVQNPAMLWLHYDILGRHGFGPAPALSKAVLRSPAMIRYLDLEQSNRGAPNENFARELFELFVLGEGHYTEHDIKEAAKAFTGYRQRFGQFLFNPHQHDPGAKTVFGHTGRFNGDDVIDLAYQLPAAGTFLPHELVKFYLSDTPLPPETLAPLGAWWSAQHYDLGALARRFFGSRLFFAPEYRGNFIKSPLQFYLGLEQELALDVPPLPRRIVYPLRSMGQWLFNPPNVRGWVGGKSWINSATLAARRLAVESLFAPIHEESLNADEQRAMEAARTDGAVRFTVDDALFVELAPASPAAAATRLVHEFLAAPVSPDFVAALEQFLTAHPPASPAEHLRRLRRATVALLQSPEYQFC